MPVPRPRVPCSASCLCPQRLPAVPRPGGTYLVTAQVGQERARLSPSLLTKPRFPHVTSRPKSRQVTLAKTMITLKTGDVMLQRLQTPLPNRGALRFRTPLQPLSVALRSYISAITGGLLCCCVVVLCFLRT